MTMLRSLVAAILISTPSICHSAASQHRLCGRIVDPDGEAVGYATIIVQQREVQITGTTSDSDGRFALRLADGSYTLSVRFVGYDEVSREVTIEGEDLDIAEIVLKPQEQSVGEVVVTADRIRRQADRFVVEVEDSDTGKDAAQIVAQSPGVWLSDNGLSINGAAGTKLYVGGREVRLSGEEIVSYLRNMPSEDIARIEVIPTATADYAADARGGIVAITLRRRRDGSVSSSGGYTALVGDMLTSHKPSASVEVGTGRWTFTAAASAALTPQAEIRATEQRSLPADDNPYYDSRSYSAQHDNRYTARIGAFVDIDERHSLGAEAEYLSSRLLSPSSIETAIGYRPTATFVTGEYLSASTGDMLSAAADYSLRIDTIGSRFRLTADYTFRRSVADNTYAATNMAAQPCDTLYANTAHTRYDIVAVDGSLDKRFSDDFTIKAGVRCTRTSLDYTSQWLGNADGAWHAQAAYDADNDYTETVAAAYATASITAGRWSIQAGVRGEYTATIKRGHFDRRYFDLFPNAGTTLAFDNARRWILAANYSRNIERPAFSQLDPTRIQNSEHSYAQGNPDLRPTYIHRISTTLIYRYRFTLTVGGNLHRDLIRELCLIPDDAPSASRIMPVNHHSEDHWFVAVDLPLRIGSRLNLTINAVGVNQRIRLHDSSPVASHNLLFANALLQLSLPAEFRVEASWSYHSRLYSGNSEVAPLDIFNLTVRKHLCHRRLTLHASIYNIFDRTTEYATHPTAYDGRSRVRSGASVRHFRIGISYSFATGKRGSDRRFIRRNEDTRRRLGDTEDKIITKNQ